MSPEQRTRDATLGRASALGALIGACGTLVDGPLNPDRLTRDLAAHLIRQAPYLGPVRVNPALPHDIIVGLAGFERLAVEIAFLRDNSPGRDFTTLARDWAKLQATCWAGSTAALSLAVFFSPSIDETLDRVVRTLGRKPVWTATGVAVWEYGE